MKPFLVWAVAIACCLPLSAQITPEFSHTEVVLGPVKLSASGFKYFHASNVEQHELALYNLDGTLFKQLTLPPDPFDTPPAVAWYVSESLFDTDSSTVEYLLLYYFNRMVIDSSMPSLEPYSMIRVADEFGNILFEEENANTYELFTTGRKYFSIYGTDQGTKMQLMISDDEGTYLETKVYGLAGSYPTGIERLQNPELGWFELSPNPNRGSLRLSWDLPGGMVAAQVELLTLDGKLVKSLSVPPGTSELQEELPHLSTGMYFYQLRSASGQLLGGKRMVLLR